MSSESHTQSIQLQIKPLTQEERQNARALAQQAVVREVGERPLRENFDRHTASRYPPSVTRLINILCIVLLLAAFTPSAIRLFVIGSETFGAAVPDNLAMIAVGIATVLTAEIGQVVFSLALATLGTTPSARRLLYASMGIATAIALVGNVQVALPGHHESPFAWLEAIAPPLLVLSTAYVLKEQLLEYLLRCAIPMNGRIRKLSISGRQPPLIQKVIPRGCSSMPMPYAMQFVRQTTVAKMCLLH
jgi:hypothetical protein